MDSARYIIGIGYSVVALLCCIIPMLVVVMIVGGFNGTVFVYLSLGIVFATVGLITLLLGVEVKWILKTCTTKKTNCTENTTVETPIIDTHNFTYSR